MDEQEAIWITEYNAARNFDDKAFRSFCYAPFINLDLSPNGEIFVCCANIKYGIFGLFLSSIFSHRLIHPTAS